MPGYAQSDIRLTGIGGRVFYTDFEGSSAVGFGGVFGFGQLNPNLHLEGSVDFWSKSFGSGSVKSKFRDISFAGLVKYKFTNENSMLTPFVTGGAAIHLFNSKVEQPTYEIGGIVIGGDVSDTDIKIGIDLGGGVEYAVNPTFDLIGTVLYRIVSDVNQLFIAGGFLIHI
jgi:opacity protein-like surface antigen